MDGDRSSDHHRTTPSRSTSQSTVRSNAAPVSKPVQPLRLQNRLWWMHDAASLFTLLKTAIQNCLLPWPKPWGPGSLDVTSVRTSALSIRARFHPAMILMCNRDPGCWTSRQSTSNAGRTRTGTNGCGDRRYAGSNPGCGDAMPLQRDLTIPLV